MTFDFRAVITDEIPDVKTVVVRTWLKKAGEDHEDERAFLIPKEYKLTDDNPLFMIAIAADQQRKKIEYDKSVERGKKAAARSAKKKEEKPDGQQDEQ